MTQKDNDQDYMDPILTPGNLRKFVENLPGKAKHQHSDYQYNSDSDIFEHEINEFFTYTEVAVQLQEYRRSFEKEFPKKKAYQITQLLDGLEYEDQELRLQTCKHVVYFALGCFTTDPNETKQQRMDRLLANCGTLISNGAFLLFFQKLQLSCNEYLINSQKNTVAIYTEIDLYMTLLYLVLESQRHQPSSASSQKFKQELVTLEPNLTEFLFLLTSKLRDRLPDKSFPTRKTVLLLWKSTLFISGGLKSIKSSAEKLKSSLGIPTRASVTTKCTPQDVLLFQQEIAKKYPGYTPPNLPLQEANPMTVRASPSLATALGYSNAIEHTDLLYHTLFPPKSLTNATKSKQQQQNHLLQNYFPSSPYVSPAFPLPLSHTPGSDVPHSISEAGNVCMTNLHVSLSNYQIIQERSKGIHHWQNRYKPTEDKDSIDDDDDLQRWLEGLYAKMLPELQNIIVVLLKLLLTSVSPSTNSKYNVESSSSDSSEKEDKVTDGSEDAVTLEYLEEVDTKRSREVMSKAISGLLLLLLKWSKSSHVLKYEYISQLLADSGCMLLILKIIGLQEVTDMVTAHTDVPYYSFFDYNINRMATTDHHEANEKEVALHTNRRNMYWSINFLRILQMLTKHKPHRIMLLVQYKSAAILKRLLKIAHPVLEQYVLKLLKSQVPYLGRKWKSQNMRVISAIYLNCKTVLQDDWICKTSADDDVELGKMEEQHLRILTRIYNGERYIPSFLPPHDEVYTDTNNTPSGPGFNGFQNYDLDASIDYDCIDLEPEFINNYSTWLETEVFNTDDDQEKYGENPSVHLQLGSDTPIPSTPYPISSNSHHFTPEELTFEINKLYVQELNAELKPATPLTINSNSDVKKSDEAWDSPPTPKKLTPLFRYDGNERSMTYLRPSISLQDEEQKDEQWQIQTWKELMSRLFLIEEKAAEKWLTTTTTAAIVAGDGKKHALYHFQLFDRFEQELYSSYECSNTISSDDDYPQDSTSCDDDHPQRD
ncbi:n1221-domain-containing protein [Mucor ambiguus]|uniref:N1221-domain-containing protein n=1 Tax=Mucor ambiguus TaxID=91626 RepID=A0A0C9M048_9FUNG|nr:n1221-domain-containing protein [Mucor ambiguus]